MKLARTLSLSFLALFAIATPGDVVGQSLHAAAGKPGKLRGTVSIKRGRRMKKDRSNVVVYIENVPGDTHKPGPNHRIGQKNKQFTPQVNVINRGTTVDFPNDDKVFHNVFSVSRAAPFDLGLYRSGASKSVEFQKKGVVDVYCNIHPQMAAKVLVVDTSYYTVTGPDGKFELPNLPPGSYTVKAWQANGDEFSGPVEIPAGGVANLDITVTEKRGVEEHTRKDGTPYGRYQ